MGSGRLISHCRQLRLIYGVVLLALIVYTAWAVTYSGRTALTVDRDWCVIANTEVVPCPS